MRKRGHALIHPTQLNEAQCAKRMQSMDSTRIGIDSVDDEGSGLEISPCVAIDIRVDVDCSKNHGTFKCLILE